MQGKARPKHTHTEPGAEPGAEPAAWAGQHEHEHHAGQSYEQHAAQSHEHGTGHEGRAAPRPPRYVVPCLGEAPQAGVSF